MQISSPTSTSDTPSTGHPVVTISGSTRDGLAFGRNRDIIEIHGDIVSPMPPEWFEPPANSGEDQF